ncbi:MAG: TetR/AcrR family transcriptional regulator [Oscillatoria sp. SIO1A7]|nr:TetR/AcrR family transcriptional regulator [Oscillatoria sp. SIO1A7]
MNVRYTDKKQRILDATMELIAENGLHATPMSQISKRSKVSAGAIYNYFPSKEALINHLYIELKKKLVNEIFRGYNIQAPYKERFFLIWRNWFNYFISNPMELSFIEQCYWSPVISEEAQKTSARYLATYIGFIAEGIESGHIKKIDTQLIVYLLYGSIVSTAKLHLSGSLDITDEYCDAAARTCWDGLKAV